MNQILNQPSYNYLNNDSNNISNNKKKDSNNYKFKKIFALKFQLFFSTILTVLFIVLLYFYLHSLYKKESLSSSLISNYSIYKLYADNSSDQTSFIENNLLGIIEIPKIEIYYPIFSRLDENLLKISPCKIYGESPNEFGNLCIAGHNYNNSLFFSNINLLNIGDEINIYDNCGNKYIYTIFDNYEVQENDVSPIFDYPENEKIVTLVTCNNFNNNRIIIKAKQ